MGLLWRRAADSALLNEETLIVRAVADFEPQHLRLLRLLARSDQRPNGDGTFSENDWWFMGDFELVEMDMTPAVVGVLIGGLLARGTAVSSSSYFGGISYTASEFGRKLLMRLDVAAALNPPPTDTGAPA